MMLAKLSGRSIATADFQRDDAGDEQRNERQQDVADPPQRDPQEHGDRQQRIGARLDESGDDGGARLQDRDRPLGRVRRDRLHGVGEGAQNRIVVLIAGRRDHDAGVAIRA